MTNRPSPPSAGLLLRSLLFTAWMYGLLIVMGLIALPMLLGPRSWVMALVRLWIRLVIGGLKLLVGLTVEFRGREHLPTGAALIAAKHLGMLDTLSPFAIMADPCYVLKRELMRLPVYGWYAAKTQMIPVDRGAGSAAVKALSAAAMDRLRQERQIVIFPEGTRKEPDEPPLYKSGVAALYRDLALPCTPMATNSGLFWPAHGFVRRPGVAVFEFLEAIPPGLPRAEFMRRLETQIETATNALLAEAGMEIPVHAKKGRRGTSEAPAD